jgi:hypothetical protein
LLWANGSRISRFRLVLMQLSLDFMKKALEPHGYDVSIYDCYGVSFIHIEKNGESINFRDGIEWGVLVNDCKHFTSKSTAYVHIITKLLRNEIRREKIRNIT